VIKIIIIALGLAVGVAIGLAHASTSNGRATLLLLRQSSYRCPGIEPYPPVGCKGKPRCLCDSDGRCSWVFDCDGRDVT
jgi:hypothetical protein